MRMRSTWLRISPVNICDQRSLFRKLKKEYLFKAPERREKSAKGANVASRSGRRWQPKRAEHYDQLPSGSTEHKRKGLTFTVIFGRPRPVISLKAPETSSFGCVIGVPAVVLVIQNAEPTSGPTPVSRRIALAVQPKTTNSFNETNLGRFRNAG